MSKQDWHSLTQFESHDLVKSWYKKTHGKQPNTAKTTQINALFTQGREYFRNSAVADLSVKPLLLYYGVLSLSRGAILLQDDQKREESLKPGHGLRNVDWQKTLSGGIGSVLELQIRACDGTFRELVESCPNKHVEQCFYSPKKTRIVVEHDLGTIKFADGDDLLTLDDLLSRLMNTSVHYQAITGRRSKWFPAIVTAHSAETHFALFTPHVLKDFQEAINEGSLLVQPTLKSWPNLPIDTIPQFSLVFRHEPDKAHQERFPVFHSKGDQQPMIVIQDFPNSDKLSEFFKLYLTSYVLGMLARYFPSRWIELLRYSPGDFARPLLMQAIEEIEDKFPKELSRLVPQHSVTLG